MTPLAITYRHGTSEELINGEGWDAGVPGLLIVRTKTARGNDGWGIILNPDIVPGRYALRLGYGYTNPEAAIAAIRRLAKLADWTIGPDEIKAQTWLAAAINDATGDGDIDMPERIWRKRAAEARR